MKTWVIFLVLLLMPLVYAQEEYQNYQNLNLNTKIISSINLDEGVDYLSSELSFFPKDSEFQKITKKDYSKNVFESADLVRYEWNNPDEELVYILDYSMQNSFNMVKIKNKIPFPITVPPEYNQYLKSTDIINSDDPVIKKQAEEIIKDEDDLYKVVYKLASWNKENIEYSLETLTEELTQNSLWVLQNRRGVCDELTVLFIAMLRSQRIPAKFVSGQSYTNLLSGFGNHAWAEVYFPGKGWVPFDVTYGQYGYVDATHIKMKESYDAKEPSVKYRWSPGSKNINVKPLNISTKITSTGNKLSNLVNVKVNTLKNKIKSGSYLPIEIELENTKDYYLSSLLYLTKAPNEVEDNIKSVLLKPNEKKKVYWIITVPDNLEDKYLYTSKIEILDFFGSSYEAEVEYANKYSYYSLEEAQEKIHQLEIENNKPESSVDLFCSSKKIKYYSYENVTLVCIVNNDEGKMHNFNICLNGECNTIKINPSGKKELEFNLYPEEGNKEYHVSLSGDDILKSSYFDISVIKSPRMNMENVNYPEEIKYKDSAELTFDLVTESPAKDLIIKMDKKQLFTFDVYEGKENFIIPFDGKYFYKKNRKLTFEYKDDNGKEYKDSQEINVQVTNVPFYIKIGYWWVLVGGIIMLLFFFRGRFIKMSEPPTPKKN